MKSNTKIEFVMLDRNILINNDNIKTDKVYKPKVFFREQIAIHTHEKRLIWKTTIIF